MNTAINQEYTEEEQQLIKKADELEAEIMHAREAFETQAAEADAQLDAITQRIHMKLAKMRQGLKELEEIERETEEEMDVLLIEAAEAVAKAEEDANNAEGTTAR